MITETNKPTSFYELVGNKKSVKRARSFLPRYNLLITGPAGIGKTTFAELWASTNNYKLVELNSSEQRLMENWVQVKKMSRTGTIDGRPALFLLDEADGIQWWRHVSFIEDIIKKSKYPFVLTANDGWKIPEQIKKLMKEIRFYPPYLQEVVDRVKQIAASYPNKKVNYGSITRDIRTSILSVFADSEKEASEKIVFDIIRDLFTKGKIDDLNIKDHAPWIEDTIPKVYKGFNLFNAFQTLHLAVATNRIEVLKMLPRVRSTPDITYPAYLKRVSQYSRKKKEEKKKKKKE